MRLLRAGAGELTFPDRVRLAMANGLEGEALYAFVSKDLLKRVKSMKVGATSESPEKHDENEREPTLEQQLDAYMQQWLETVAEVSLKGRIEKSAGAEKEVQDQYKEAQEKRRLEKQKKVQEEIDVGGFDFDPFAEDEMESDTLGLGVLGMGDDSETQTTDDTFGDGQ